MVGRIRTQCIDISGLCRVEVMGMRSGLRLQGTNVEGGAEEHSGSKSERPRARHAVCMSRQARCSCWCRS